MTRSPTAPAALVSRVTGALAAGGLSPSLDPDGDVEVDLAGQRLYVRCVPSEPAMLRIFGHWLTEPDPDELTRLRAANAVTGAVNLVKATVDGDRLSITIDLVLADGLDLRSVLPAALDAVLGSARTWHETVDQLRQRG